MIRPIAEGAMIVLRAAFWCAIFGGVIFGGPRCSVVCGRRTVGRDVTVPDIVSAAPLLSFALSASAASYQERGKAKSEQQSQQGEKILHEGSSRKNMRFANGQGLPSNVRRRKLQHGYIGNYLRIGTQSTAAEGE